MKIETEIRVKPAASAVEFLEHTNGCPMCDRNSHIVGQGKREALVLDVAELCDGGRGAFAADVLRFDRAGA